MIDCCALHKRAPCEERLSSEVGTRLIFLALWKSVSKAPKLFNLTAFVLVLGTSHQPLALHATFTLQVHDTVAITYSKGCIIHSQQSCKPRKHQFSCLYRYEISSLLVFCASRTGTKQHASTRADSDPCYGAKSLLFNYPYRERATCLSIPLSTSRPVPQNVFLYLSCASLW